MNKKKPLYRMPWELAKPSKYYVQTSLAILSLMRDCDPSSKEAVDLIEEHWSSECELAGKELPYGLYIPRRYGLTGLERAVLADTESYERQRAIEGLKLIERIATETLLNPDEVKRQLGLLEQKKFDECKLMLPYMSAFTELVMTTEPPSSEDRIITIYMHRIIPKWTVQLTTALHSRIVDDLRSFAYSESLDDMVPSETDEKKDQAPSPVSPPS